MAPVVMIVDDEVSLDAYLAAFLEDEGMRVVVSHSGEEALRQVKAGLHAQVCIMDLRLPGMDGNQAVIALHEVDPVIRFLIHTGSSGYMIPPELAAIGITPAHVFNKPADVARLARAVLSMCDPG
jgi:DNA-binding NtrC family response regulator